MIITDLTEVNKRGIFLRIAGILLGTILVFITVYALSFGPVYVSAQRVYLKERKDYDFMGGGDAGQARRYALAKKRFERISDFYNPLYRLLLPNPTVPMGMPTISHSGANRPFLYQYLGIWDDAYARYEQPLKLCGNEN